MITSLKYFLTLLFFFAQCLLVTPLHASEAFRTISDKANPFSNVLQHTMPAVVNITVQGQLKAPPPGFPQKEKLPRKWQGEGPKFNSVGSGVIIDAKRGYIITNAHLLQEAKTIVIMLSDGRKLRANRVGIDEPTDLALLQVEADKLSTIPLADISQLKVGDFVAAIGNPFGLQHTVTSGMVSALNRSQIVDKPLAFENFIQTDASINPGNSGGALINIKGELVGINTAIVGPISGNVGIGFAIPIDMVYPIMQQLAKYGKVNRGILGISVQDFTPNLADAFNMPNVTGALVTKVTASPAEKAGLQTKDVILQMNQTPIKNAAQLRALIAVQPKSTQIQLTVRRGSETKKLKAVIGDNRNDKAFQQANPLAGIQLQNYDAYSLETGELKGIEVTYVDDNSDAWIAGLRSGHIILSAYGEPVESINALVKLVNQHKDQPLLLNIWRSGGNMFIVVP